MTFVASSRRFLNQCRISEEGRRKEMELESFFQFDDAEDSERQFFVRELSPPPNAVMHGGDEITLTSSDTSDIYMLRSTILLTAAGRELVESLGGTGYFASLKYNTDPSLKITNLPEIFQFWPKYEFHNRTRIDGRLITVPYLSNDTPAGCIFDPPWPKVDKIEEFGHLARFNNMMKRILVSDEFVSEFKRRNLFGLEFGLVE